MAHAQVLPHLAALQQLPTAIRKICHALQTFKHVFDSEGFEQEIIDARDIGLGVVGVVSLTSKQLVCCDIGSF